MMKDLASTASFPPAEATVALKLMMNCRGSDLPLNLGKVMGLYEGARVSSTCLQIVVIWNLWFCGFVVKCRVCRRLVGLWYVVGVWVGFDLLNGAGWTY